MTKAAHATTRRHRSKSEPSADAQPTRRLVGNAARRRRKMIAFGWYGGKYVHLDFILPHLPADAEQFCDVYGGSAAVLVNRPPAPAETYNDLDSELVNFFAVLRDRHDELIRQIGLTPFSREELARACQGEPGLPAPAGTSATVLCSRPADAHRAGADQQRGRWAHCVLTSRAGMAGAVSRWLGAVDGLPEIAQRLQRVQIENAPALEVVARYDTPRTLFYLDPPYVHGSRGDAAAYGHEMSDADHRDLAALLHGIEGRAVLSGYRGPPLRRAVRRLASGGRGRETVQLVQGQAAGDTVDELPAGNGQRRCQGLIESGRSGCWRVFGARLRRRPKRLRCRRSKSTSEPALRA